MLPGNEGSATADTLVNELGLTGLQFINVMNGCATAGQRAGRRRCRPSSSGQFDLGLAVGFDKHPRGMFNADPATSGLPQWYGDLGFMVTTQFFAMKINRYLHDHDISEETLTKVAAKAFRNGSLNPNAWRQQPISEEEIRESRLLNHPLTQYMLCSPDEGAAAVVRVPGRPGPPLHLGPGLRAGGRRAHPAVRHVRGLQPRGCRSRRTESPTVDASRAVYEMAGIGPADVQVAQIQDSESGRRDHAHGRERLLRRRRAGADDLRRRDRDRRSPADQHRRRAARQRRAHRRVGHAPDPRDRAAAPRRRRPPPGPGRPDASATHRCTAPRASAPARSSPADRPVPERR